MCVKFFLSFMLFLWITAAYSAARQDSPASKKTSSGNLLTSEDIPLTDLVPTGEEGNLRRADVQQWFLRQGLINYKLLSPDCVRVEKLSSAGGGYQKSLTADQIFFILGLPKCSLVEPPKRREGDESDLLFVLKHYNTGDKVEKEIHQLNVLKKEFRTLGFSEDMPRIVFAESFYRYPNSAAAQIGKQHDYRYISLIHPAKGENLWTLTQRYVEAENQAQKEALRHDLLIAYARLGEVLAHFHLKFMHGHSCPYRRTKTKNLMDATSVTTCKTRTHGDLHPKNIFWDKKTRIISFIDIATLAEGYQLGNWIEELGYFYGTLVAFSAPLFEKDEVPQLKRKALIVDLYSAFLNSYLAIFHEKRGGDDYQALKKIVTEMPFMLAMFRVLGNREQGDIAGPAWFRIKESIIQ